MSRVFQREKKTDCRNYREVDILPRTEKADRATKGKRGKRQKVSEPKQRDLNDKNAKRYLVQLGNGNFGIGDIHLTATYDNDYLPATIEEAERIINNYLRRVAYRRSVLGLDQLKYILVTEYKNGEDGEIITRVHHHVIMNGGMDRDDLELMWTFDRINWRKSGDLIYRNSIRQLGWVNADRIQVNENGIEAICKYVTKNPNGKKRWSSSRNLERPIQHPNADHKYTKKQIERLAKTPDCGRDFFEKQFPDFNIVSIEPEFYKETGWHIYMKMWRKQNRSGPGERRRIKSARTRRINTRA
ncbi:rolling circle replication-associated protein [Lacrimispora indolis]|uniref:rolling circle replication-associated protein n=1 Tax=Lacrimispora indolis TaxID=69825 RepID=UPI0004139C68|nr:hypothetical protein [[Clostridium] methoxybenzovorans]